MSGKWRLLAVAALGWGVLVGAARAESPAAGGGAQPDPLRVAWDPCAAANHQPEVGRFGLFPPPPVKPCEAVAPEGAAEGAPAPAARASDCRATPAPCDPCDFSPDPGYVGWTYCPDVERDAYAGKYPVPVQRPWVEWGFPLYDWGPVPRSETWLGPTNLVQQKFYVYGDWRVGAAQNQNIAKEDTVLAHRLNLEADYWITSTERVHAFFGPFQEGNAFMRVEDGRYFNELDIWDADTDTLFFEGDLGQMLAGCEGRYSQLDLPITAGLVPMFLQNGVWMQDAFWGAAVTIPARNSPRFDWSNFDVTFFAGLDQVSSDAFGNSLHEGELFGATTFIESRGGYAEVGYAYVSDASVAGRSYHNIGVSYTRRYLNLVSNSVRVIANTGQDGARSDRTADGVLLLVENSLLTREHYHVVPYVNFFAGFGAPQPAARAAAFGGVLFNTGILYQSDALTGYPTLDASGNDTVGMAVGVDLLAAPSFNQQLLLEASALTTMDEDPTRRVAGDQLGVGARWQAPLNNRQLLRADVMHGWLEDTRDITGARVEWRWKF